MSTRYPSTVIDWLKRDLGLAENAAVLRLALDELFARRRDLRDMRTKMADDAIGSHVVSREETK